MTNWINDNYRYARTTSYEIDWIKTFIENESSIGFDTAAPGSGSRLAVAADYDTTFGNFTCKGCEGFVPYFNGAFNQPTGIYQYKTANTHFGLGELFEADSSLAVSGKYCYLPSDANLYRKYQNPVDYSFSYGSLNAGSGATNSRATPANKLVLLYAFYIDEGATSAVDAFISVRDTGTSTEQLECAEIISTTQIQMDLTGMFRKPIPIPENYELYIDSGTNISTTAYYAEVDV